MHLAFLRDYHEALVIALARTLPTLERGTVAEVTGLTPQAVSKVLARLVEEGLLAPAGVRRPALGKPAAVYRLVPESRWAIGAQVTRRELRLALTDLAGTVRASATTPLPDDFTPEQLLVRLAAGVTTMIAEHRLSAPEPAAGADPARILAGVGVGMIGPLDQSSGTVRGAHRLRHWRDVPLAELAERELGLPVVVDKDVTAGVTAEAWRRGPPSATPPWWWSTPGSGPACGCAAPPTAARTPTPASSATRSSSSTGRGARAAGTAAWKPSTNGPPTPPRPPPCSRPAW